VVAEQHAGMKPHQVWDWLSRLAGSPLTFLCLAAVALTMAAKLVLIYAALAAPAIQGWSWGRHPNTLLVAYRSSTCGCGAHLSGAIGQAAQHHAQVLVVASAADAGDAGLAAIRADRRVRVVAGVQDQTIRGLSPSGRTTLLSVQGGRITNRATGSVLPDDFFH
jgi:hypothetical protein